ncbi:MAG: hypothetical protein NC541_03860 [bacterium]|nr:hypothetical protein [bacterium]MCM1500054.1 hypothetical protein [Clostridium sp.]
MKKVCNWWKYNKRYITFIKALLLALLPVTCCVVTCAAQGRRIGDVYLPSSEWNDELLYYKQVEAIINYGYPQGYFGYNESHALNLSFGAWSPLLFFPWVVWGLLFGWNLMSPILCNIFLMSLSCFLFVWLVRPSWKQLGILTVLFSLYTLFVRYMLSGMPEVICFSMLILLYSLAFNYLRQKKSYKLVLLFLLSALMAVMRPYLLLFMLLPAWLWIREGGNSFSKGKRLAASFLLILASLGLYACIKHYLGTEYFWPLFFTDWIVAFFEQGFFGGIRYTLSKIIYQGQNFITHIQEGIHTGLASGAFFAGYLVCLGVLIIQSIRDLLELRRSQKAFSADRYKRNFATTSQPTKHSDIDRIKTVRDRLCIEAHMVFSFLAMLLALLLMYTLTEGSKHLLTFIAAAVFVIAMLETRFYKKAVLVGVTFAYFYIHMAIVPYDYQIPFRQEERAAAVEEWREIFADALELNQEQVPSYDNTLMWAFNDTVDTVTINAQWQLLYALPEGFGISCCMPDYVIGHIDSLRCRYLYAQRGGLVEAQCLQAGYEKIAEDENSVLFQIN